MIKKLIAYTAAGVILVAAATPLYAQESSKNEVVVGTVEKVNTSDSTVVVKPKGESNKQVQVGKETPIINEKNRSVKLGAVKLKDLIAVVSTDSGVLKTEGGEMKVKKIFVMDASSSAQMSRRAVHGIITQLGDGTMTLVHQIQGDRTYQVNFNVNTIIMGMDPSGATSLAVGQRVAAVGHIQDGGGILAKIIRIIPGKATGIFKKQPLTTPSGTPSATPSPKATATAAPTEVPPTATPTAGSPSPTP